MAARSPIALLSAEFRMPMFAATAAVPAMRTPAIAAAVMSDVRLVHDRRRPPGADGVDGAC